MNSHTSFVHDESQRDSPDAGNIMNTAAIQGTMILQKEESEHKRYTQGNQKALLKDRLNDIRSLLDYIKDTDWMFEKNEGNAPFTGSEYKNEKSAPLRMNCGAQERHF